MDPNNGIDPNAGASEGADLTPDNGAGTPSATPEGQGGTPDPRDQQIADMRKQNSLLNKAVIDARRQTGRNPGDQPNNVDLSSPEGQYGVALQVAENQLRSKLEDVLPLYPELTPEMVQRIRRNPWAFASREAMLTGNSELAALEIEQAVYDQIESAPKGTTPAPSPSGNPVRPQAVNTNPAPESPDEGVQIPGTNEDGNPWTMPLDKLEALAKKEARTPKN